MVIPTWLMFYFNAVFIPDVTAGKPWFLVPLQACMNQFLRNLRSSLRNFALDKCALNQQFKLVSTEEVISTWSRLDWFCSWFKMNLHGKRGITSWLLFKKNTPSILVNDDFSDI